MKKILSLLLAFVLCLSCFAGCGDDSQSGSSSSSSGDTQPVEDTPEFVYVPEYIPVKAELENSLSNFVASGDTFLTTCWGVIADNTPEGVVPEYEGEYWVYGQVLYLLDLEGNLTKVENYLPMEVPEDREGSSYINDMTLDADGNILLLESMDTYYYNGPEGIDQSSDEYWNYYQYETSVYLRKLSPDGTELSSIDLMQFLPEGTEYFYANAFEVDNAGNIYIAGNNTFIAIDTNGAEIFTLDTEFWVEGMLRTDSGVSVLYYGQMGYELCPVDLTAKGFGEAVELNGLNMNYMIPGGGDFDFYYSNGSNLFGYDIESGTNEKVLNWINCDINPNNVSNTAILEDGRVVTLSSEWNDDWTVCENELVVLTKKPYDSVPHKTTLTFASLYVDYYVRDMIIDFNKSNAEYRIEVRDYSEYNTEEDYTAGATKLKAEIMAGNVPDIICLDSLPADELIESGYLVDLYPLLDADEELSRDDLFPSILACLETDDGKLYRTCSSFQINTIVGASSVVGYEPGWTYDEFKAAYDLMPDDCDVFDVYTTQSAILSSLLSLEMSNLVNWETGECFFNTEAFTDMLEFTAQFPSEFDWENYDYSEETGTRIASGRQMLLQTYIYDFWDFRVYPMYFGGEATFIGWPSSTGNGSMFVLNSGAYAIGSTTEHLDVAWDFVKTFLTEEYQTDYVWGFPTNLDAFNAILEREMTPMYETDMEGNYVLDENGNKIEISQGGMSFGDGTTIDIYALTQEQADQFMALVNSIDKVASSDATIMEMVIQDSAPFFAGEKTAEDIGKMLQSKISLYVNEKR